MLGMYPPPPYGPVRFEYQPASVRRRGRKGKALRGTSKKARRRASRKASARSSRRSGRSRNKVDYRKFKSARATTYGPVRFETQPTWVRKRGRKGKALSARTGMTRKEKRRANRAASRGASTRGTRRAGRKASRSPTSRRNRRDYRAFKSTRAKTFGPVRFERQPTWVRKRGRKGKALSASRRSARSASRRSSARSSKRSSKRSGRAGRSSRRNRALARSSRRSSSRTSRRSSSKRSLTRAGRVLTYADIMRELKSTKLKAWVCAGKKRTGCGGGKRGSRGSRQIGVLRP